MDSIPTLTEWIIHSLDYEKVLEQKLTENNLEYILKLLAKYSFHIYKLFTVNERVEIEQIIKQQIDDNKDIKIQISQRDTIRFANIVMDIINTKNETEMSRISSSDGLCDSDDTFVSSLVLYTLYILYIFSIQ